MVVTKNSPLKLFHRPASVNAFVRAVWDPVAAVLVLAVCVSYYREHFNGPVIMLSIITFSLLYPGDIPSGTARLRPVMSAIKDWFPVLAILYLLGIATGYFDIFDPDVIRAWVIGVPLVWIVTHYLLPRLAPGLFYLEGMSSVVIIGANETGRQLANQLSGNPQLGAKFVGFFDDRGIDRLSDIGPGHMLGRLDEIPAFMRQGGAEAIFIALPMASQPRILKLLDDLKDSTASIYFVPDIFVADLIQARVDQIGGMPVVAVCETPFHGVNELIKRISDVFFAAIILILIAPLLLIIAAAVKLTSPGPVLFRQRRYGLDGKEIVVYKFRSMTVCEDGAVVEQARRQDARLTRLGAFLRRTSLDELPQFINVLQGRMSVVGPRPHAISHNELYRGLIKGYMVRHKVKPGITGLAQVSGCRGETETVEKMEARIKYDLDYLRSWSLRLDTKIILRTIWLVLRGDRQAY